MYLALRRMITERICVLHPELRRVGKQMVNNVAGGVLKKEALDAIWSVV